MLSMAHRRYTVTAPPLTPTMHTSALRTNSSAALKRIRQLNSIEQSHKDYNVINSSIARQIIILASPSVIPISHSHSQLKRLAQIKNKVTITRNIKFWVEKNSNLFFREIWSHESRTFVLHMAFRTLLIQGALPKRLIGSLLHLHTNTNHLTLNAN